MKSRPVVQFTHDGNIIRMLVKDLHSNKTYSQSFTFEAWHDLKVWIHDIEEFINELEKSQTSS